jgi:hypothetical protein
MDWLLVGPGGQKFVVLSDAVEAFSTQTGANIVLRDDAAATLPPGALANMSGTWKPTNHGAGDAFAVPAPAAPHENPGPAGSATFASVFGTASAGLNGTWSLYGVDDASGDVATVTNWKLTFESNDFVCSVTMSIGGTVTYGTTPAAQPTRFVPGVLLSAAGAPAGAASSDAAGAYSVTGLAAGAYTLTPTKTGDVNGISAGDGTLVLRHVAAGGTLLTASQQAAADANAGGTVTAGDATLLLRYVAAGGPTALTGQVGNWKFLPANRSFSALNSNATGQDFVAVLLGEVSGNWTAAFAEGLEEADDTGQGFVNAPAPVPSEQKTHISGETAPIISQDSPAGGIAGVTVSLPTTTGINGTIVTVPVTLTNVGNSVSSYSFAVFFNPAVLQPVGAGDTAGFDKTGTLSASCTVVGNAVTSGRLGIAAAGCPTITGGGTLINLRFTVVGTAPASTTLTFGSVVFEDPNIDPIPASSTSGSLTVAAPTASNVSLGGRISTAQGVGIGKVRVAVWDAAGGVRYAQTNSFGYYRVDDLAAGGTYTVIASSKRHTFDPPAIVRTASDEIVDADFVALP